MDVHFIRLCIVRATCIKRSCYVSMLIVAWLLPMVLFCVVLRAFILVAQFEIMKHIRLVTSLPLHQVASIPLPWYAYACTHSLY
jgi:hypothetical protein